MSKQPLHPSQFSTYLETGQRSRLASWGLIAVAWGLIATAVQVKGSVRVAVFGSALAVCAAAKPIRETAIALERLQDDVRDISHTSMQNWLWDSMKPAVPVVDVGPAEIVREVAPAPYDFRLLNRLPHLLILGGTGDGKTTLVRYLLTLLQGGHLVLDPHGHARKWAGLPCVGIGRDFTAIADALDAVHRLMLSRFRELARGVEEFPMVNVVIDEFPAIAAKCNGEIKGTVPYLLRESRKVGIRVIVLAQGAEVKTLGVEGEGSLRDQLEFIRLGKFALDYARQLQIEGNLKGQNRPCLVGDEMAIVPDLTNFNPHYQNVALPQELLTVIANSNPIQPNSNPIQTQFSPIPPEFNSDSIQPNSDTVNRLNQLLNVSCTPPESAEFSQFNSGEGGDNAEKLRKRIAELKSGGLGQNQIVFVIWGVKAGGSKGYKDALQQYKKITGES